MANKIDLHFEKIKPKNHAFLNDHEKLIYQMQVFRGFYFEARNNREHNIKIIHGSGKGKLKEAVHNFLNEQTCISQIRPGLLNEGGEGVTIAYFKL
ncbi:MAG: hypothetical protein A3H98_04345 [Bacteroidetes bacterium RIFCSPLOWO2_02_FULL_36_8]|nr:MAG: hypothetical protein A3H98_04345 [Bacteroidetes bacterium RIFCSPLOWO2_02_FULL_36_8]OFY68722.1 MAG: hypothetical protein A3G23_02700 [Bacteroidetes bacterium RIFCSPLOWO2_12_FULL_37_12]